MITFEVNPFPGEDALRSLWLAAWNDTGPASFDAILARSLAHVGAFNAGRLVGYVNLAWDGGIHVFVLDTCVHPNHRRRGVGTGLVKRALEVARQHRIHWAHVDYERQLAPFYERCGFRPTTSGLLRLQEPEA